MSQSMFRIDRRREAPCSEDNSSMPRRPHSKHANNPDSDETKYKSIVATVGVLLLIILSFQSPGNKVEVVKENSFSKRVGNTSLSKEKVDVTSASFDVHALRDRVREATALLKEDLRSEYGKYYADIFESPSPKLFQMNQVSRDRLLRRMMKKIIEASTKTSKVPFTWVTAGHSAAAGHGNLFTQSKTYALEEMASKIFSAAGLNFIGKNYAMGGMGSGPELVMCMSEIYGVDIDVITWDFGMTDGRDYWKIALWGARGASHPTRPIQVLLDSFEARHKVFRRMEDVGVGLFIMNDINDIIEILPDYEKDSDQSDVPKPLKYLVCGGQYEGGKCKDHKYDTTEYCPQIAGQVSWHPGWKHHQLNGRLLAHYMISMLNESLDLLVSMSSISNDKLLAGDMEDLEILLNDINSKDKIDNEAWIDSASTLTEVLPGKNPEGFKIVSTSFYRGDPMCSSAILPSDARYNGLVTGGDYDTGIKESDAQLRSESANGLNVSMTVVHSSHRTKVMCPKYGERDYKDYYYIGKVEDDNVWHTRIFPSDAEYDAFSKGTVSTENFIMACLEMCDWGNCAKGYVGFDDDLASIYVDNNKVEKKEKIGACYLLFPSNGEVTWVSKGTKPGQYEIEVKLNGGMFMRITSIVIVPFIS